MNHTIELLLQLSETLTNLLTVTKISWKGILRSKGSEIFLFVHRTPEQLEMLKKIGLPSFMSQSVFGNEAQTLYDWINSQDDRSNLDDLLKECQVALNQVSNYETKYNYNV